MFFVSIRPGGRENIESVRRFIRSRGRLVVYMELNSYSKLSTMRNDADYGLQLLTSTGERSWYNMIRKGSTITMEAWDNKYKPNQDWNHAWVQYPPTSFPGNSWVLNHWKRDLEKISD